MVVVGIVAVGIVLAAAGVVTYRRRSNQPREAGAASASGKSNAQEQRVLRNQSDSRRQIAAAVQTNPMHSAAAPRPAVAYSALTPEVHQVYDVGRAVTAAGHAAPAELGPDYADYDEIDALEPSNVTAGPASATPAVLPTRQHTAHNTAAVGNGGEPSYAEPVRSNPNHYYAGVTLNPAYYAETARARPRAQPEYAESDADHESVL